MIWGELSAFLNKKEDHTQELALLKATTEADQAAHQRSLENMRLQSELGVKQIEVQSDAHIAETDSLSFLEAQKSAFVKTGIMLVDAWNGVVRPAYATVALGLWVMKLHVQGYKMDDFDISMVGVISGFFFADRSLKKLGK
jgi:hypothetical protein